MRPLKDMDTIQIEITNYCHNSCSNCTRLCGHHAKPYFMDYEYFKKAVDSLIDFPNMVGMMGGEPLYHPDFEKMCDYMASKIPKERLGLWTCLPEGKSHHRTVIAKTFGNIFLNDHTRDDILHGPVLVASDELSIDKYKKEQLIDKCWVQNYWSASINPHGAFFCEIAASLSMLLDDEKPPESWPIEPGWWKKIPEDFKTQVGKYCKGCGAAMPLKKRCSIEGIDDISPKVLERIKDKSPKIKRGQYEVHKLKQFNDNRKTATYKDMEYRQKTVDRYGMFITVNTKGFCSPYLKSDWSE